MNRNRAELALLVLSAAVLAAACVGSQQTGAAGGTSPTTAAGTPFPTPSATASPSIAVQTPKPWSRPSLSTADSAVVDRALGLIDALGGTIESDATVSVSGVGPDGSPATVVSLGSWRVIWDKSGRLVNLFVVLAPYSPTSGGALSEAAVRVRLADIMSRLGTSLGAPTSLLYEDYSTPDWRAQWSRILDGFPVPSDGTAVIIQPDGTFQSFVYSETPNAPAPAHRITQAQAIAKAGRCVNIANGSNGRVETCTVGLEWHKPFQQQGHPLLRLCWRVSTSWNDDDQNYGGGAVWLDAGTGEVIDQAAIS